jgi:phage-related protein
VLYVAKFAEGVYVLHAFEKRTRHTRKVEIELAWRSLGEVLRHRRR